MKTHKKLTALRNKCDRLLSPLIIKLHPKCLLCRQPTEVAHHHVHKSKSNALRYYLPNLINLCHSCHQALHHNESYYASRIVTIKGIEWFQDLEKIKNRIIIKVSLKYYEEQYEILNEAKPL